MVVTIDSRKRKVDLWPGFGIFILPFYFAWRLREPGYSRRTRPIGCGWSAWMSLQFVGDFVAFLATPDTAPVVPKVTASDAPSPAAKRASNTIAGAPQLSQTNATDTPADRSSQSDRTWQTYDAGHVIECVVTASGQNYDIEMPDGDEMESGVQPSANLAPPFDLWAMVCSRAGQ